MSRKEIRSRIISCIKENKLDVTKDAKQVADMAIDCTLDWIIEYVQEISHELAARELYSHSMAAGLIINKLKGIKDGS